MENKTADLKHSSGTGGAKFDAAFQSAEKAAIETIDKAKGAADAGLHTAQQAVSDTYERAKGAAQSAANTASDAANYVVDQAENATSSVGGAMENTGLYLQDDGLHHIAKDVTDLIRRNPIPAMLFGAGLGFLIAVAANRRSA